MLEDYVPVAGQLQHNSHVSQVHRYSWTKLIYHSNGWLTSVSTAHNREETQLVCQQAVGTVTDW